MAYLSRPFFGTLGTARVEGVPSLLVSELGDDGKASTPDGEHGDFGVLSVKKQDRANTHVRNHEVKSDCSQARASAGLRWCPGVAIFKTLAGAVL
jgi:hypothetical protein